MAQEASRLDRDDRGDGIVSEGERKQLFPEAKLVVEHFWGAAEIHIAVSAAGSDVQTS